MQRLKGLAIAVLLAVSISATAQEESGQELTTVRITNGEWPPYLGRDEPGYGVASRIVTRAFERAGYEVEYGFFPWSRSLYLARQGKWDGAAVWLPSEQRFRDFYVSEPVIFTEYVFFHRRDMNFDWDMPADLSDYRIGLTQDYDYGKVIETVVDLELVRTETVSSDRLNFEKLIAGRIDLFPMDRIVGQRILEEQFSRKERKKITWHPHPVRLDRLRLLLSREVPENAERMEAFNEALREMRKNGEIEEILVRELGRVPTP
ncbi:amino acid ABC transporter substrate-binding protein (PAAT family) [Halospina denitrificans]|uniref:Amino acid ABC transporter substrate-binding protein (PAAT family) n=1 Tax=Halospina denitrificans TaxID=332522 RepID=A0A4R7JM72_9GAMM|nr:transporter substrate-binding domain-containing protein [Halospina denitrificans]TDT37789.1 amino acid ABC transporter substrate-binding protein (PAAT family) [Halospina denitrificans]